MTVAACDIPCTSGLDRRLIEAAYFRDAYRAPLSNSAASVVELFFAVFGHHPAWLKRLLIVRNRMASLCGLDVPTDAEIVNPDIKTSYQVGETIGPWPIFSLSQNELVAGRNNQHLDFRLSVLKITEDETSSVVVSTVCTVHNAFGRVYLFFIVPFHKWGVKQLIANAIAAARL